jgi:UDP-galactopyranose mutase
MESDYLIVGAGPFGCAFARQVAELGRSALVIDRRPHIAGNCYSECDAGIHVHRYGPHIFHTANERVWKFVRRFARFNDYRHTARVRFGDRTFSFPINLGTLRALWGVESAQDAKLRLECARVRIEHPSSLRDRLLSEIGEELYAIFYEGYSTKQWGRNPAELPATLAGRIPIRLTDDDHYFGNHIHFEGIPIGGYTAMFQRMLEHPRIRVELGADFFADRDRWEQLARRLVFTGKIDAYFDYEYGELEYRSLDFVLERHAGWYQEVAMVNYADASVPFTRTVEHKHFEPTNVPHTIVTREFPRDHTPDNEPYYPIVDQRNSSLYRRYRRLSRQTDTIFGGRLGTYQYYNMDQVIAQAVKTAERELASPSMRRLSFAN